ncbi:MAG: class I SAM-dependent methyltransferase [Candidatus Bathyarchaeota archaeon]|nr:MAG: class I SAM-dependent methyltransferase [Candidatus Bathyarchaeota archaeon]
MRISFDSAAEIYDKTRGPPKQVMKQLVKALASELHGYKTALDVGVGTGRFAKPLQDSGLDIVGVDIAKKMINKAAERGVRNLLRGDACFLPYRDSSFEVLVCIHLLHLISEWKTALQEICRVTQRIMVSMNYVRKNPIWETYDHLLKGYGYESRRLGKGEWELKDLVRPSKSVFVASYDESADEHLTHLSQGAYSIQWQIPEDVNKKVVDELKHHFAGKVFSQEIRILVWNVNDLKAYCESF